MLCVVSAELTQLGDCHLTVNSLHIRRANMQKYTGMGFNALHIEDSFAAFLQQQGGGTW
jgi:hypothetical protein